MSIITSLQSYYSLDEASGTGLDAHGSQSLPDVATNVASATGKVSGGREFDSTTDRLEDSCDTDYASAGAGSVSIWIKPTWPGNDGNGHSIWWFTKASGTTPYFGFQKYSNNNVYVGFEGNGLGDQRIITSAASLFSSGSWSHHVFTWDDSANDCRYYVNGSEAANRTSALTSFALDGLITLGNKSTGVSSENLGAILDECGVWKRALSSADVTWLYNSGSGRSYADIVAEAGGGTTLGRQQIINGGLTRGRLIAA